MKKNPSNAPPAGTALRLDWATHEAAKYACEKWHYSGAMPKGYPNFKVGVWERGKFVGVVVFGRGASNALLKPYGLKITEGAELTRVALEPNHITPVSRVVTLAIRLLKKHNPGLRLLVSFADPEQGHVGGIYQAMNWIYAGRTAPDLYYIDKSGKRWHSRSVSKDGRKWHFDGWRRCPMPHECTKVRTLPKHRYLMPLDDEMRRQIEPLRKPYPKRAGSKVIVAPPNHGGEGGETPTPALQDSNA